MQESIFYQLSIVMVVAAAISLIMRLFRQPLIIGYIIAGFVVGPSLLNVVHNHEAFDSFSQIGISLLLFIIGLGINITVIKDTGKPVFLTFLTIIIGIGLLGLGVSHLLDYTPSEGLVMAGALLFSSTIIVVKALSDRKEQSRMYGQIAIGILLAEDIAATFALVLVAANGGDASSSNDLVVLLSKAVLLASGLYFVGGQIMPRLSKLFATNQELLYVFALAWAFGVASTFQSVGFSIEVGALFAGVSLAHLPYVQSISTRLRPLRDFFIVLFFIRLGEELGVSNASSAILPALLFSAMILIGKPLLIMSSLGWLGYTKQTSFKTAVHLSQISEFSIVLVVLAASTGLAGNHLIAVITLTALITIAVSSYMMKYDDRLYRYLQKPLGFFERKKTKKEVKSLASYPLILIGYREGGNSFVQTFRQLKKPYIVIDYDPDVVDTLERQHIKNLYGDATDTELLEEIGIHRSELVISTITAIETNLLLANHITEANEEAIFICHATTLDEANTLYNAGATYVFMPHFIGDEHLSKFISKNGNNKQAFERYRREHLALLEKLQSS